jgi:hypothetical protein
MKKILAAAATAFVAFGMLILPMSPATAAPAPTAAASTTTSPTVTITPPKGSGDLLSPQIRTCRNVTKPPIFSKWSPACWNLGFSPKLPAGCYPTTVWTCFNP